MGVGQQSNKMSKIPAKKKFFCMLVSFEGIFQYINQKKYVIEQISKSFESFYLINSEKLEFFSKKKPIQIDKIKKELPKNCLIIDPKNSAEFLSFAKNKELIILSNVGRLWRHFKIHYLLKKTNSKLIYLQNIGNFQTTAYPKFRSFMFQYLLKHLPHKIIIILSILNFFPKVQLRFLADKRNYEKAINNFYYKFSKKNKFIKLFYTEDYVLINSLAYDITTSNIFKISEEKIVMVDTNINHKDNIVYSGRVNETKVKKIYKTLEIFLNKISKLYNKSVVVCVHPSSNLKKIKSYLKNFEVVKYKTKENIYKSFLTFFYDSSSIVDAFILRKNLIVLENEMMGESLTLLCNIYPPKTGIMKINLNQEFFLKNKNHFIKKIRNTANSKKYNDFVNTNLQADGVNNGTKKFIKIITDRYFN